MKGQNIWFGLLVITILALIFGSIWWLVDMQTQASYEPLCKPLNLTFHQCFWMSNEQIALVAHVQPSVAIGP